MIEMDEMLTRKLARNNKRLDGRDADSYRDITIETDFIKNAEGSCRVKLGNTEVVVGVKLSLGTPYPDSPAEGVLIVNAELVPMASPEFERGPPGQEAIELARVVDRAIRESKCIAFDKLCVEERKSVWMVNVDMDILDDDGNLIDASCLAAVAAIATARFPEMEETADKENYAVKYGTKTSNSIPMNNIPVSTTFVKINGAIMADPTLAELKAMDARLTIGTLDNGKDVRLCSMQKGGPRGLVMEEIEQIINSAVEQGKHLRKLIKEKI